MCKWTRPFWEQTAEGHSNQGRKRHPKPKLFGLDIFGWGGGLPREGVGSGMSFEAQANQTFWRDILGFWPGCLGGARKVWVGKLWSWQIAGFREIAPKWLGEGAKGLWVHSGQIPFALVKCWVAPVQNKVSVVQEPFLRLLLPCPKRPFAPSPNHFGRFTWIGPFARSTVSQSLSKKSLCSIFVPYQIPFLSPGGLSLQCHRRGL